MPNATLLVNTTVWEGQYAAGWGETYQQLSGTLAELETPVLLLAGTMDVVVPPENAERLASVLPNATLVELEGWGHGIKDPHELAASVSKFLDDA